MGCSVCFDLQVSPGGDWSVQAHLRNLESSARAGCPTCALLRDGVLHCVPERDGARIGFLRWMNVQFGACLPTWKYSRRDPLGAQLDYGYSPIRLRFCKPLSQ